MVIAGTNQKGEPSPVRGRVLNHIGIRPLTGLGFAYVAMDHVICYDPCDPETLEEGVAAVRRTVDDLMRTEGKAELINGRIVRYMPTGELPGTVASNIAVSLRNFAKKTKAGRAYTGGVGFVVDEMKSGRESFCPDAAFRKPPLLEPSMKFVDGAPTFAVEVRSESDYTRSASAEIAAKRADYLEAGTLVVWDVDTLARAVHVYRPDREPETFSMGQIANAEPAVAGWSMPVAEMFED